jgi:Putative peptidoglycan binding domain/L,D-transpeptidase catalytic domain
MRTADVEVMVRLGRSWLALAAMSTAVLAGACGAIPSPHASPGPSPVSSGIPTSPAAPATPPPTYRAVLMPGMSGPDVRQLQQRLAALMYYPGPIDGQFGPDTQEAVWAFQEVQGITPTGDVGPVTRHALADPRNPVVLVPGGGSTRVEINLALEVLVLYRADQVALISHVSTGGGYYYCSPGGGCGYAITPVGDFQTTSFMPGWVTVPLGQMYNPVFFIDTAYAIHGDTDVPLQPVSHGCVRIPMDIAEFFHDLVTAPGTPVYIRN